MKIRPGFGLKTGLFTGLFLLVASLVFAGQVQDTLRHKVAIFTPLYLDSAFDARGQFRYEKTGAKFSVAGVDFYFGVQTALDSLRERGAPLEVFVYDTRSRESIAQHMSKPEMEDVDLIIAHSNAAETRTLAEIAQRKKVPFISATLPNDAGVYNNPYFVVLNSTLQSHVEGIYRFLQRYHPLEKAVVFRKRGAQEEQVKNFFTGYGKATAASPVDMQFVDVANDFSPQFIARHLDSTRKNIVIAGSLEEWFGLKLALTLADLQKKYQVTLIGMPTWDNFNLGHKEISSLEIIYSTPFYYNKGSDLENRLGTYFSNEMHARAGEMFYRGYETMLRFGLLLLDTRKDLASNLTRKGNYVLTPMDIQPVFKDRNVMNLDYFENKHLYFIKVLGGSKNVLY